MEKRGQVTLFIILGIFILVAAGTAFYYKGEFLKDRLLSVTKAAVFPENVQLLKDELSSCYLVTAQEGLVLLGRQGGYIFPPEGSLETGANVISYAYDKKARVPSLQAMAGELQEYMDLMLPLCPNFDAYSNLNVEEGAPRTSVSITEDKVKFMTRYAVSMMSGNDTFRISEPYTATMDVKLSKLQDATEKIAMKVAQKPDTIDPEYLLTLGLPVDIIPYDRDTAVYLLQDPQSKLPIGGEPFIYMFATRK